MNGCIEITDKTREGDYMKYKVILLLLIIVNVVCVGILLLKYLEVQSLQDVINSLRIE